MSKTTTTIPAFLADDCEATAYGAQDGFAGRPCADQAYPNCGYYAAYCWAVAAKAAGFSNFVAVCGDGGLDFLAVR